MRISHGIEQVPSTFTTRKLQKRTRKPIFCKILETLRAATFELSSLQTKKEDNQGQVRNKSLTINIQSLNLQSECKEVRSNSQHGVCLQHCMLLHWEALFTLIWKVL